MTSVFAITAASESLPLDRKGQGDVAFTVANQSGRRVRGRSKPVALSPAQSGWLSIVGESERDFAVGGVQQFTVHVAVPLGSKEGKYTFRLDTVCVENPDEEYSQGPAVAFTVPKQEVPRGFRSWIIALPAAVIVIGITVASLFSRGKVEVPKIRGTTVADANSALAPRSLRIGNVTSVLTDRDKVDQVLEQNPPAGTKVSSGSAIDVQVGVSIVTVPPLTGKSYNDAVTAVHSALLNVGHVSNVNSVGATPGVVLSSNPAAGNSLKSGSTVDLSVQEENVRVPNLIGQNFKAAIDRLTAANLKLGSVTGNIYQPVIDGNVQRGVSMSAPVTDQSPKSGTVPVGSQVNLVFPNSGATVNPAVVNQVAKASHW